MNADGFANAWLRRRLRICTARQVSGHQKVLGLGSHCLTPQKNPGFDSRVTSGTTFLESPDKILVASQNGTSDLALDTLTC